MFKLQDFGEFKTIRLEIFLFFAEADSSFVKPFQFVDLFFIRSSFLRRNISALVFEAVKKVSFLPLIDMVKTLLDVWDEKRHVFEHEICLVKKTAILDDF